MSYMKENKKRKQILESTQYWLKITLEEELCQQTNAVFTFERLLRFKLTEVKLPIHGTFVQCLYGLK